MCECVVKECDLNTSEQGRSSFIFYFDSSRVVLAGVMRLLLVVATFFLIISLPSLFLLFCGSTFSACTIHNIQMFQAAVCVQFFFRFATGVVAAAASTPLCMQRKIILLAITRSTSHPAHTFAIYHAYNMKLHIRIVDKQNKRAECTRRKTAMVKINHFISSVSMLSNPNRFQFY